MQRLKMFTNLKDKKNSWRQQSQIHSRMTVTLIGINYKCGLRCVCVCSEHFSP